MPTLITIPQNKKKHFKTALESIRATSPAVSPRLLPELAELEQDFQLNHMDAKESITTINEDSFHKHRAVLLSILDSFDKVTVVSQQLWLILKHMARIHPINTTDIFSLDRAVPSIEQNEGDWFFASSGHAFPIADIVKCQRDNRFINPCISAQSYFNHCDQIMIKRKAGSQGVPIPNPRADAERWLRELNQRYLIAGMNLGAEIARELPSFIPAVVEHFSNRGVFSGGKAFLNY